MLRRIRAIAALDPEVGAVIAARDERRRIGLQVLAARFAPPVDELSDGDGIGTGTSAGTESMAADNRVDIMHTLTSFETFDSLAGATREPDEVIPLVTELVLRVMTGRYIAGHGPLQMLIRPRDAAAAPAWNRLLTLSRS